MTAMIDIRSLTKRFGPSGDGGILAVDAVSFSVEPGEVLGFLGPNGAGKSTTMKMATGFLAPTSGDALVKGHSVVNEPLKVKEIIGYLPEGAPAYPDMTPESFLRFCAEVRGLHGEARRKAVHDAAGRVNLQGVMRQPIDTLSKGFKRRVGLAQAIMHNPDVLIMDEPTDGLDPNQKHEVRNLIKEMAGATSSSGGGKAIVLSTHILEEVEAVCTRAIIIAKGRVVADSTPAALMSRSKYHNAITLSVVPPPGMMVFEELKRISGVRDIEDNGRKQSNDGVHVNCTVIPKGGKNLAIEIGQLAKQKGWQVESLRVETGRLDDVFREMTGMGGGMAAGKSTLQESAT
jgi:ABC-2 type transport system ATP-binding protein